MPKSVFSEPYKRFRAQLIAERKAAKLSQADVAHRIGKLQTQVSKYEQGERRVDFVEFVELAEAIGFDPVRFLRKFMRSK